MPVRIYKNGWFHRFCRKEKISDASLRDAVARADRGLVDADFGGGLIKQRVPRPGAGRSGGFRTLIFFRAGTRAVFAFGFAKSERDNIDVEDEADLKKAARITLGFTQAEMDRLVAAGTLMEVASDADETDE